MVGRNQKLIGNSKKILRSFRYVSFAGTLELTNEMVLFPSCLEKTKHYNWAKTSPLF